ncbi:hypothetical protein WJX84_007689 [Apatococcus fuscideae]|uniref:Serine/threonine-protein phosphatase n=1 Tax=Apatococcus fuscideae TaxID=2026836 RepID=A0AAW1S1N2_9CHLO
MQQTLLDSTRNGIGGLSAVVSAAKICSILDALGKILKAEPTVKEVQPQSPDTTVTVVGDTHGQFHDVCKMLQVAGAPSASSLYVFNGDFVDRGAWGLETLMLLACWKLTSPGHVTLLRGNHETTTCTYMYGFRGEIFGKYAKADAKEIYRRCKGVFAMLPLAAVVNQRTLVMHGGLFRKPQPQPKGVNKRKRKATQGPQKPAELGNLSDLRSAGKGGLDPNGLGAAAIAADVLWSDPVADPGLELNEQRGVGTVFGPDVTERFLAENHLGLILRSHEGPDARYKRDDMPSVDNGYALDHECNSGKLYTVFSAPDYPQFQADEDERYNNVASVAVLSSPSYDEPRFVQYSAVLPRPAAVAFYEYQDVPGSDEEMPDLDGAVSEDGSQAGSVSGATSAATSPPPASSTKRRRCTASPALSDAGPGPGIIPDDASSRLQTQPPSAAAIDPPRISGVDMLGAGSHLEGSLKQQPGLAPSTLQSQGPSKDLWTPISEMENSTRDLPSRRAPTIAQPAPCRTPCQCNTPFLRQP